MNQRRTFPIVLRWLVILGAVVLVAWSFKLLGLRTAVPFASVPAVFDSTPDYPGYTWTRNGIAIGPFELNTIAGPRHCGWQSATYLHIGWPPGSIADNASRAHLYIRDPQGVVPDGSRREPLDLHATLPTDARSTGYRLGAIEIYVSPSDENRFIYVVGPSGTERWPRSDPMTLCM